MSEYVVIRPTPGMPGDLMPPEWDGKRVSREQLGLEPHTAWRSVHCPPWGVLVPTDRTEVVDGYNCDVFVLRPGSMPVGPVVLSEQPGLW